MLFRSLFGAALAATSTMAASLQAVTGFGTNPSQIQMYIYVPDKLATKPAIVVAVSYQAPSPHFVSKSGMGEIEGVRRANVLTWFSFPRRIAPPLRRLRPAVVLRHAPDGAVR